MTLTTPLQRIAAAAGAILAAFVGVLLLVPLLLPTETVRETTTAELTQRLGLPVAIRGGITLSVFPQLSVRLDDVRFGDETQGSDAPVRA